MARFNRRSTAEEVVEGCDLSGRHAIVTGANTGIGLETARLLVRAGCAVTLACRNQQKGEAARQLLLAEAAVEDPGDVQLAPLDLSSLRSVRDFAESFLASDRPIHLLINNAGLMLPQRTTTQEGFEAHFGVNHLGHFLLTQLLTERVGESAPARIVNLSSDAMQFATLTRELADLNWEERPYSGWRAYGDSKLMNLLTTNELNRRLEGSGVVAAAVHPGIVTTELGRDLSFWMKTLGFLLLPISKNPAQGAATTLYAATAQEPLERGGGYYANCAPARPAKQSGDTVLESALWERSEQLLNNNTQN